MGQNGSRYISVVWFSHAWKSSIHVNTSVKQVYTLTMENVEMKHAGKFDCLDNEGYKGIKESAEVNVIGES